MAVRKHIQPATVAVPKTAYSHGIEVNAKSLIFVSGQLPFDVDGNVVGEGDFKAQVTQVFENLKAVLETAKASFDDVVKVNYYLTDIKYLPVIQEVRVNYLTKPYPASTAAQICALAHPKAMIEIEVIAAV